MVDEAYLDKEEWVKKSIRTTAMVRFSCPVSPGEVSSLSLHHVQMGKLNSDRAIMDYAQEYWNLEPTHID